MHNHVGLDIGEITPLSPPEDIATALSLPAVPRGETIPWWQWPNVVAGFQHGAATRMAALPPYHADEDRGVVIVGGGKYLPSVYITVRVLRHVGCRLPIEVWHFDGETTPEIAHAIAEYDAVFVNADQMAEKYWFRFLPWHWWKGWQLKSFALMHSRFREVLYLDADCYPNRDPEYLFEWPTYGECGAVIWPDVFPSPTRISPDVLDLFQIGPPAGRLAESGQLLINRETCWQQLVLAGYYNQSADITYRYVWGDKDTFPFAWMRTDRSYGRMWPECQIEQDCILQFDYRGHVIFQHRVSDKFKLTESKFQSTPQRKSENRYHGGLALESFCFHALYELRERLTRPGNE